MESRSRQELLDPRSEYRQSESAFKECDEQLTAAKLRRSNLPNESANEIGTLEEQTAFLDLEKKWNLAKQQFELAIERRTIVQEQIATLEEKLKKNLEAQNKLVGTSSSFSSVKPPSAVETAPIVSNQPTLTSVEDKSSKEPPKSIGTTAAPVAFVANPTPTLEMPLATSPATTPKLPSKELIEAQNQVQKKIGEAHVAELAAQSVSERIDALDKDIALERKLLTAAQKKSDLAYQENSEQDAEHEKRLNEGASPEAVRSSRTRCRELAL